MTAAIRLGGAKRDLPPGTLVHIGDARDGPAVIRILDFDAARLEENPSATPEEACIAARGAATTWIDVGGLHDTETVRQICEGLGIHPLTQEDIVNTSQRPKIEDYDDYLYVVLRLLALEGDGIRSEQISLVLGDRWVVSFRERTDDAFDHLRERLRAGKGRIRREGADYLLYSLLDSIVDGYFTVLEAFGERIEDLEDEVIAAPDTETLQAIYVLRRSLIALRRSIWPLREVVAALERGDSALIRDSTAIYLRDVYDHAILTADAVETYRDTMAGILDIYLSGQSNQMNQVMKVLTVIATIFIPLTFVAGVYGMNFAGMPELEHPWGYPVALASMLAVALAEVAYFRKRGWI